MIPILGKLIHIEAYNAGIGQSISSKHQDTHLYQYHSMGPYVVDGRPDENEKGDIAAKGLALWAMANEPASIHKATATFTRHDYLTTVKDLEAGDEITAWYGNDPGIKRVRSRNNYTVANKQPTWSAAMIIKNSRTGSPQLRRAITRNMFHRCPKIEPPWHGLPNLGNSCYIGSALQATINMWNNHCAPDHRPAFVKNIAPLTHHETPVTPSEYETILANILPASGLRCNSLTTHEQGSAREFITYLIQHRDHLAIRKMHEVSITTHTRCDRHDCYHLTEDSTDMHIATTAPIQGNAQVQTISVSEMIHQMNTPRRQGKTPCPKCGGTISQQKTFTPRGECLMVATDRPLDANSRNSTKITSTHTLKFKTGETDNTYELHSAIRYTRNRNGSGHYSTISKRGGKWLLLDDHKASELTEDELNPRCETTCELLWFYERTRTEQYEPQIDQDRTEYWRPLIRQIMNNRTKHQVLLSHRIEKGINTLSASRHFVNEQFESMQRDTVRNNQYRRAIEETPLGATSIDIGCGAHAILALQLANKTTHCVAVELNEQVAKLATSTLKENTSINGKWTVITGDAAADETIKRVQQRTQDPLIIAHEIFGHLASSEAPNS